MTTPMTSTLTTLPRVAVTSYLRLLRLPVDAAGSITRHDEAWAPVLAFDAFEAQVLGLLGSVLRDDDLVQDAKRQKTRVEQLRRAAELEAAATERRVEADQELEQKRSEARSKAKAAEDRKEREEDRLEESKESAKRNVRKEAAAKQSRAKKAADARESRLEAKERDAEAKRLAAERTALDERREALEASGTALKLDKAASAVKDARKRSN
jgi:hypothetical protein